MGPSLEEAASGVFDFLEEIYGFSQTESSSCCLHYESPHVFVEINYDRTRSYELGCSIGRLDDYAGSDQPSFDLGEVVRSAGEPRGKIPTGFQVTTRDALERSARRLAEVLVRYAHRLLLGDLSAFAVVHEQRRKECAEYALTTEINHMRRHLDKAWSSQDYPEIIRLLKPLQGDLLESERMKLDYAEKQIGQK